MKKSSLSCLVTISIAFLISLNPLHAADRKEKNKQSPCLFLRSALPVTVLAREGDDYLLFRGNATSEVACAMFREDVERELPPGAKENGVTAETRPYGFDFQVEINYKTGKILTTLVKKGSSEWCSVWIRSKTACREDPQTPFATGVLARQ